MTKRGKINKSKLKEVRLVRRILFKEGSTHSLKIMKTKISSYGERN